MNANRSTAIKARQLAKHEVNWWKAHHRRQQERLLDEMTRLYVLQFNLDYNDAKLVVQHRVIAAKWHDMAENLEDAGNKEEAEIHWTKTEEELQKHYMLLLQLKSK
ncbi:MAG: hypothetical protein ACYC6R_02780 [Anaerolineales bacterium]